MSFWLATVITMFFAGCHSTMETIRSIQQGKLKHYLSNFTHLYRHIASYFLEFAVLFTTEYKQTILREYTGFPFLQILVIQWYIMKTVAGLLNESMPVWNQIAVEKNEYWHLSWVHLIMMYSENPDVVQYLSVSHPGPIWYS